MDLIQRWTFAIIMTLVNIAIYSIDDWEFYVIAVGIGIIASPLFREK